MNAQKKIAFISSQVNDIREVKVSVRFGNPQFADCRNFGICKMDARHKSDAYSASKLHHANAILQKKGENIWMSFIKASMHPKTMEIYFGKRVFEVKAQKKINNQICLKLETSSFFIKSQLYNITTTENHLIIQLR